ncbi:MAG: sigma-70 family RNA polymerase sigma factor [Candidatus Zixiibacteriota bacterium]|nr:MAG: sigma-70 family RNA polymerase sigma factor [candidate division Zixibacteria bacterium]
MSVLKSHGETGDYFSDPGQDNQVQSVNPPEGADHEKKERFERLFIPLMDRLYNLALRITRNPDDAEDLVQETYLKAYRFFDNYRINTNAKAWIMTIMINTFRTRYRKSQKTPAIVNYEAVENFLPAHTHDPVKRPANRSEARDMENITEYMRSVVSDDIIKALEAVPIQFRMPVLLSDAEQFNYQEISEILGINIGTVKSRIFRGRRLLKKSLFEFAVDRGICRK